MKHVVIIAPFVTFPGEPGSNRFITVARRFSRYYKVTLVTSRFCHFTKLKRKSVPHLENINVVLLDEPGYTRNVSLKRFMSHGYFCHNLRQWLAKNPLFDLAYSAFPLIETNLVLARHTRVHSRPLVIDVQDIWPETIAGPLPIMSGLIGRILLWPLRRRAQAAFRAADAIIAVSETYLKHADQGYLEDECKAVAFIGADKLNFNPALSKKTVNLPLRAAYIGTFAGSYDLETLIRASTLTKNATIEFIGTGPDENRLRSLAIHLNAPVLFHGALPYEEAMKILSNADVALNPIRLTALQSVTNKLSDYFCSGLPIISSQKQDEVQLLLAQGGGIQYQPGDAIGLASLLDSLAASPERLEIMANINRVIASEKFLREHSYTAIDVVVDRLIKRSVDNSNAQTMK